MIDLNEVTSRSMQDQLGQNVLICKPILSHDLPAVESHNCPMAKEPGKSAFKQRFIQRVRWARDSRGLSQDGIAALMGISQDTYKQYETRSYLPHDLVPLFLLATGVDAQWLYTEKGKGPISAEPPAEPVRKRRAIRKDKRAAAA